MADTVTTQMLNDGHKHLVMHFTNKSDGTGESAVTKVTLSSTLGNMQPGFGGGGLVAVTIDKIDYSTNGIGVDILWDANTPTLAYHIPPNSFQTVDFRDVGKLQNSAGAGKTGNIKFTTTNNAANGRYTITLYMSKKYTA